MLRVVLECLLASPMNPLRKLHAPYWLATVDQCDDQRNANGADPQDSGYGCDCGLGTQVETFLGELPFRVIGHLALALVTMLFSPLASVGRDGSIRMFESSAAHEDLDTSPERFVMSVHPLLATQPDILVVVQRLGTLGTAQILVPAAEETAAASATGSLQQGPVGRPAPGCRTRWNLPRKRLGY